MRKYIFGLWLLLSGAVCAQAPRQSYPINVSRTDNASQFHVHSSVLNTPILQFPLYQGTTAYSPTNGWGAYFKYGRSDSDPGMHEIAATITGNVVVVTVSTNDFPISVNNWFAECVLTASVQSVSVRGQITIRRSPGVSAPGILSKTYSVNGSEYGPWTGSFSGWPFVEEGALTYAKYPTNTWVAGYLLSSTDGGTTTYAVASDAALVGVAITNIASADGSVVMDASGVTRDLSVTQYVQTAIAGIESVATLTGDVAVLKSGTSIWYSVTNKLDASETNSLLYSATAAATYSTIASNDGQQAQIDLKLNASETNSLLYASAAASTYSTIASNDGQQAQIDAKISSVTASQSFYLATNPSEYIRNNTATNIQIYSGGGVVTSTGATGTMQRGHFTGTNSIAMGAHGASINGRIIGIASISNDAHGASINGSFFGQAFIRNSAKGASIRGTADGVADIGTASAGASIHGSMHGTNRIGSTSHGAYIRGLSDLSALSTIGDEAYSAGIAGYVQGTATIGNFAYGAGIDGWVAGTATIGSAAVGSGIEGYVASGASATNNGVGALQLLDLSSGEHALTTANADGSILLGPGTNNVKYSIRAKGGVWTPSESTNELGIVTGNTFTANSFTGEHLGKGAALTGLNWANVTNASFTNTLIDVQTYTSIVAAINARTSTWNQAVLTSAYNTAASTTDYYSRVTALAARVADTNRIHTAETGKVAKVDFEATYHGITATNISWNLTGNLNAMKYAATNFSYIQLPSTNLSSPVRGTLYTGTNGYLHHVGADGTGREYYNNANLSISIFDTIAQETARNYWTIHVTNGAPTTAGQAVSASSLYTVRVPTSTPITNLFFGAANIGGAGTNWVSIPVHGWVP